MPCLVIFFILFNSFGGGRDLEAKANLELVNSWSMHFFAFIGIYYYCIVFNHFIVYDFKLIIFIVSYGYYYDTLL